MALSQSSTNVVLRIYRTKNIMIARPKTRTCALLWTTLFFIPGKASRQILPARALNLPVLLIIRRTIRKKKIAVIETPKKSTSVNDKSEENKAMSKKIPIAPRT